MNSSSKPGRRVPSAWTVRAARGSDLADLLELCLALQQHHEDRNSQIWQLSDQGRERMRDELIQLLADEDARVIVALDDAGRIVGMVIGRIIESHRHVPPISGRIGRLFVLEPWRRRGIGTELVKRVCQFFASRHAEDISITYIAGNTEASHFWDKLGFHPRLITAGTRLHELEQKINEACEP